MRSSATRRTTSLSEFAHVIGAQGTVSITPVPAEGMATSFAESPARALQLQLERAALQGFQHKAVTPRRLSVRRVGLIVTLAILCWAGVFGAGYLLIG